MLIAIFLCAAQMKAFANACASNGTGGGNWSAAGTWATCGGTTPQSGDTVTITGGDSVTFDTASATVSSLTMGTGSAATLTISGSNALTVSGAVTIQNPAANVTSLIAVGTGTLSAGSISITGGSGAGPPGNQGTGSMTLSTGTITCSGNLSFGAGGAAKQLLTFTGSGTLNVGGNFGNGATIGGTVTPSTGTINMNGGAAQTLSTSTTAYNNVTITNSSGGVTLTGTTTFGGNLDVASGTFNVGAFTFTATGTTTVENGGTLQISSSTGTKTFTGLITVNNGGTWNNSGNSGVTIAGGITNNGTFTSGSGTYTFNAANEVLDGTFTITTASLNGAGSMRNNGNVTIGSLTLTTAASSIFNYGTLTFSTTLNLSGVANSWFVQEANSTLNINGTLNITGTLGWIMAAGGSSVNLGGSSAITLPPAEYYNLTINGGQTVTLNGKTTVSGNLNISNSSTLSVSGSNYDLRVGGDFIVASGSTFTANSGTVYLDPTSNGTITTNGSAFNNLTMDETGTNAYWKMDESGTVASVADSSGNSNTGTTTGSPTSYNTTLPPLQFTDSQALSFDGSSQYFTANNSASLTLGGSDMSISVWINPTTLTNGTYYTITEGGGTSRYFAVWLLATTGSQSNQAYLEFGGTQANGWSSAFVTNISTGSWQHLVVVRSGNSANVYINGVWSGGINRSNTTNNTGNVLVGNDGADTGVFFPGEMDDFRIYNRALTAGEVSLLYSGYDLTNANATGTKTLGSDITINGNFTLNGGTFDTSNTSYNMTVKGNWANGGTNFRSNNSTVTFNGTGTQTISGDNLWHNLTITTAAARTVKFESGKTQTIGNMGQLTLTGAAGQLLSLGPATAATNWKLALDTNACTNITFTSVTYSDASGGSQVNASGGTNTTDGTDTNWCTAACTGNSCVANITNHSSMMTTFY